MTHTNNEGIWGCRRVPLLRVKPRQGGHEVSDGAAPRSTRGKGHCLLLFVDILVSGEGWNEHKSFLRHQGSSKSTEMCLWFICIFFNETWDSDATQSQSKQCRFIL